MPSEHRLIEPGERPIHRVRRVALAHRFGWAQLAMALLAMALVGCNQKPPPAGSGEPAPPPAKSSEAAPPPAPTPDTEKEEDAPPTAESGKATAPSPTDARFWSEVCSVAGAVDAKRLGPRTFEISRAELARSLKAVERFVKSGVKVGRIVPSHTKDGRVGLRVFGIVPTASCGLQNADVVLTVDGVSVMDGTEMAKKADALLRAKRFVLGIERKDKPETLTYHVRG